MDAPKNLPACLPKGFAFFPLLLSSVGQEDWALCAADRLQQSGVLRHSWLIYDLCTAAYPEQDEMAFLLFLLVSGSTSTSVIHQEIRELFVGGRLFQPDVFLVRGQSSLGLLPLCASP